MQQRKRLIVLSCLVALGVLGCKIVESEPDWNNPADPKGSAYVPFSSSDSESPSSSSVEGASSSAGDASSSSQRLSPAGCVLLPSAYVNQTCTYSSHQVVDGNVGIGPKAQLHFSDGARLSITNGTLQIESGANLYFGSGSFVHIGAEAKLDVRGNSVNSVRFQAEDALSPWGVGGSMASSAGIYFELGAAKGSSLEYAEVTGATVGLYAGSDGLVSILHSRFSDNVKYGVALWAPQAMGSIRYTEFSGNGDADVWATLPAAAMLGVGLDFEKGIEYSGNEVTTSITLPGYPYIARGSVSLDGGAQLSIAAGATFKMAPKAYFNISNGRLVVSGSSEQPVVFEPLASTDFWGDDYLGAENQTAFHFNNDCLSGSIFEHTRILKARTALSSYCGNSVEVRDSELTDYLYYAYSGALSSFLSTGTTQASSSVAGATLRFQ